MRTFLALETPGEITEYLSAMITRLTKMTSDVKWVKDAGIHITVKFLGEIEEAMAEKIHQALTPLEKQYSPIRASLKEIDAFPDKRRARVIVVKLRKGIDEMKAVAGEVEERLAQLGFDREERPFLPHLTLGRKRVPKPFPDGDVPPLEEKEFTVDTLVFFRSTLTPAGAIYTPLWRIKLGGETK